MFHGANTEAEVEGLATCICNWAKEIIDIEEGGEKDPKVPKAALEVYKMMAAE
jgi:8-amino-7-oxononanoate synthase